MIVTQAQVEKEVVEFLAQVEAARPDIRFGHRYGNPVIVNAGDSECPMLRHDTTCFVVIRGIGNKDNFYTRDEFTTVSLTEAVAEFLRLLPEQK